MPPNNLEQARTQAQTSIEDVAKLQENVPGLLSGLKQNLTDIFAKDNPLIQQREQALQNYLQVGPQTRASLLPQNLPFVAGSPLNLSPTQQAAIESSRSAAALAPLASLNNLIVGQYGNIGDILANAAALYQAQIGAAQTRAQAARSLYEQLYTEEQARRQEQLERERLAGRGTGGAAGSEIDLFDIMDLFNQPQPSPPAGGETDWLKILDSLIEEDIPSPTPGEPRNFGFLSRGLEQSTKTPSARFKPSKQTESSRIPAFSMRFPQLGLTL